MGFAVPTEGLEMGPLVFLLSVYGYILIIASTYLGEGCEILLEAMGPAWAGIIGGILVPLCGVLPDSLMVLMSGLGPQESVAEEIAVGTGTLIGSTIMLLTIPTSIGIFLSRRKLGGSEMRALKAEKIKERKVLNTITGEFEVKQINVQVPVVPKTLNIFDIKTWTHVGGTALNTTPKGAVLAMLTSLTYLVIQIPAMLWGSTDADGGVAREHWFAGFGLIVATCTFVWYLYYVYTDSDALEVIAEKQRAFSAGWQLVNGLQNIQRVLKSTADPFLQSEALFELFDSNNSGSIDFEEMCIGWGKIGYQFNDDQAKQSFNMLDHDNNGSISRYEFFCWVEDYLLPQYIAAQPLQPPTSLGANPTVDQVLTEYPLPSSIKPSTAEKIKDFLSPSAAKQPRLTLIAGKEERYALHIFFATVQGFPGITFATHCEDLNHAATPSSFASSAHLGSDGASSMTSQSGSKRNRPQTSHFPRQLIIEKVSKSSSNTKSLSQMRPQLRKLVQGLPAWACASTELVNFYRATNDPWERIFTENSNGDGKVDLELFQSFCKKYQLGLSATQSKFLFYSHDTDLDHSLTEEEFQLMLSSLVDCSDDAASAAFSGIQKGSGFNLEGKSLLDLNKNNYSALKSEDDENNGEDEDEEDDDEEESEHSHLTESQLIRTALLYILGGVIVVTAFSDPTVDVINALGAQIGIPPFWISFIVTPILSNSSEIIASLKFAAKKTDVTLGLTLSSLYGACTMNNTCLLAVFLSLIFFRGIPWTAINEVSVMLVVIWSVGILGLKQTLPLWKAAFMFALFPLSVISIYVLNLYK